MYVCQVEKNQCIKTTLETKHFCALLSVLIFSVIDFSFPKELEEVGKSQPPVCVNLGGALSARNSYKMLENLS